MVEPSSVPGGAQQVRSKTPLIDQLPTPGPTKPRGGLGQQAPGLHGLAEAAAASTGLDLDGRAIRKLKLSSNLLGLTLSPSSSPTLARIGQALAQWESTVGDAKGVMMPRHLLNLPPPLAEVVGAIKQIKGGGALTLEDASEVLPQAMTRLFRAHKNRAAAPLQDLYEALSLEALAEMGRRYQAQVVEQQGSAYGFFVAHSVDPTARARIQLALPHVFPGDTAPSPPSSLAPREKHPGIKRNWLERLREAFGDEVPRFERKVEGRGVRQVARTERTQKERLVRITLPLQRLAELVVAAAPPGATAPMLNAVLDQELKSRGYPGLPPSHLKIGEFRFLEEAQPQTEGLRQINARRVGELVTEAADAALLGRLGLCALGIGRRPAGARQDRRAHAVRAHPAAARPGGPDLQELRDAEQARELEALLGNAPQGRHRPVGARVPRGGPQGQ